MVGIKGGYIQNVEVFSGETPALKREAELCEELLECSKCENFQGSYGQCCDCSSDNDVFLYPGIEIQAGEAR